MLALFLLFTAIVVVLGGGDERRAAFTATLPSGLSVDDQLTIFTLQGIMNRDSPTLFLDTAAVFWQYPPADAYWMNYLHEAKAMDFNSIGSAGDVCMMISKLPKKVSGLVLHEGENGIEASRWLAVTAGAQMDALPVTMDQLARFNACLSAFPIELNLTSKFTSQQEAYEWGLSELLPKCSTKQIAYSAGQSHGNVSLGGDGAILIGLDYPVSSRSFVFNLSPDESKYPEDTSLFDKVMSSLAPLPAIFGWAEPEPAFTTRISKNGGFVVCDAAPNLSFWAKTPVVEQKTPRLPAVATGVPLDRQRFYITFQTNEGDTPKIIAGLMGGEWLSPWRGKVPMSWGVDPYLVDKFPALFEFYAVSASENDTFFAGTSGGGYTYPGFMRPSDLGLYVAQSENLIAAALTSPVIVDVWNNGETPVSLLENYRSMSPHAAAFTCQATGNASNVWLKDGTPVITADRRLWYPELDPKNPFDDLESRIRSVASALSPPFFIAVYGLIGIPSESFATATFAVHEMMHRLPSSEFVFVGAADFARLARDAGAKNDIVQI